MEKDWIGNYKGIFTTLGASNHTEKERENNDYYATDPIAIDGLRKVFDLPQNIWECACGEGHLSKRLEELGYNVDSTDLIYRGYGEGNVDFLECQKRKTGYNCILTNPPYSKAMEFVLHSLELLDNGGYVIMLLKTTFLEGKKRYQKLFSKYPPKYVFQFTNRLLCAKNGDFEKMIKGGGGAQSYAWFVWEKGFVGDTIIKWIV